MDNPTEKVIKRVQIGDTLICRSTGEKFHYVDSTTPAYGNHVIFRLDHIEHPSQHRFVAEHAVFDLFEHVPL
jgi:hypothetical protein